MNIHNAKSVELNSLLEINIYTKFEKEIRDRILFFFQNKIRELSETISGLELISEASKYIIYENGEPVSIFNEQIISHRTEIINFFNPIWYVSEKILLTSKEAMIDYIFYYLKNNSDGKFLIPRHLITPFPYGLPEGYKSPYLDCFVNQKKVSTQTSNLKFSYSKKFASSYFLEEVFENFKQECIIAYKDELQKIFNYHFKPTRFKNITDSKVYSKLFEHFNRDFDISDLDEIIKLPAFNNSFNSFFIDARRDILSNLYILEKLPLVPCLK